MKKRELGQGVKVRMDEGGQVVGTVGKSCGVQDAVEDVCFIRSDVCTEGEAVVVHAGEGMAGRLNRFRTRQTTLYKLQWYRIHSGRGDAVTEMSVPLHFRISVFFHFFEIRKSDIFICNE